MTNYLLLRFYRSRVLWHSFECDYTFDGRCSARIDLAQLVKQVLSESQLALVLKARNSGSLEVKRLIRRLDRRAPKSVDLALETAMSPEALDFALGHGLGELPSDRKSELHVAGCLEEFVKSGSVDALVPLDAFVELPIQADLTQRDLSKEKVTWAEIRLLAEQAFHVWGCDFQYFWAREAWSVFEDAGLTTWSGFVERAEVYLRFIALGCLYRDFCQVAAEEHHYREDWTWATEVDLDKDVLSPFVLGSLSKTEVDNTLEHDWLPEDDGYQDVVAILVDQRRDIVFRTLVDGYGSIESLLMRLMLTLRRDPQYESSLDTEKIEGVLNDTSNMPVYEWLQSGCEVIATE